MGAVGLFAIFHGHAHGSEMPLDAPGFEYGIGFMLATSVLHAAGIFISMLIDLSARVLGNNLYRLAGGLASVAGLALLLGYIWPVSPSSKHSERRRALQCFDTSTGTP
jgi:urease accessory protein